MKILEKYWIFIVVIFVICMFAKPLLCFIILGIITFFLGIDYYRVFRIIKNYGIQVTGRIIKYERGQKGYQTPIINFSTTNGTTVETEPYFYVSSDINKCRTFKNYIGKSIEINYNPKNPEEFLIANQKVINIVGIFFLIISGIIFTMIGIFGIFGIINMSK